ncbi:uncharacterized protein [Amphiura filiformis]|uniref:uncharacterized protein n=1 Tax=Amphiura filiformis TaxID=82378 RepID=UPI003B212EF4
MLQGNRFPSLHMYNQYTTGTGITMLPFIFALITFGYIMNMNSVVCQDHFDGDVRLVDGKEWEGRIEVYYEGGWRVVCYDTDSSTDREWGDREAWVTCRQLGYPGGKATSVSGYSNTGSRKINDVRCPDDDIDSLRYCTDFEFQNTDCRDDKQAGVICYNADGACLDGYVPFQTSCYKVSNEQRTRSEAREACESDGGHLADIRSSDENEFIIRIIKASGGGTTWFGLLEDSNTPGEYIWSDRSPLIHEAWHDIDTDRDDICMRLRRGSDYAWRDDNCDDDNRFVCELQVPVTTVKSSESPINKVTTEISVPVTTVKSSESPINKVTTEISDKPTNSTSAGESGIGEQLRYDNTAAIVGSVVGVLLLVLLTLIIVIFIYKRSKKGAHDKPQSGKSRSDNNNPTYELDSNVDNGNDTPIDKDYNYVTDAQPDNDYNYVGDAQPDDDYNYVGDAQPDDDYNYVDANQLRSTGDPVHADSNNDDNTYSYAETPVGVGLRPSAPEEQPKEEGWMENTIYSTSDDVGDPTAQKEGWADNTIYGD